MPVALTVKQLSCIFELAMCQFRPASSLLTIVNVNVNKQYLSTHKCCNKGYDGCAMRVVFSKLQNCPGFNDGDFRDGGSAFQHMGPETAKAREPHVTVLVRGKSRSPWVAARR